MLYYKMLGKKIVFTAHNINAGLRDSSDSAWNRWTLKIQYHLSDHIFVHTEKMKHELMKDFKVGEKRRLPLFRLGLTMRFRIPI